MSADKAPTPIWVGVTQPGHFPSPYSLWVSLKPPGGDSSGKGGSRRKGLAWAWAGVSMAQHRPARDCGLGRLQSPLGGPSAL